MLAPWAAAGASWPWTATLAGRRRVTESSLSRPLLTEIAGKSRLEVQASSGPRR
jgi:hypothetical protein